MVPFLSLLCLYFALHSSTTLVSLLLLGYAGVTQFFPGVVLGLFWPPVTANAVSAGLVTGIALEAALLITKHDPLYGVNAGFLALLTNIMIVVLTSLWRGSKSPAPDEVEPWRSSIMMLFLKNSPMPEKKQFLRKLFTKTMEAVELSTRMRSEIALNDGVLHAGPDSLPLTLFSRILVIAVGKAAVPMAAHMHRVLAPWQDEQRQVEGIVVGSGPWKPIPGWTWFEGSHPLPDTNSFDASELLLGRLRSADEKTLVLFLVSGGASSMLELPPSLHHLAPGCHRLLSFVAPCRAAHRQDERAAQASFPGERGPARRRRSEGDQGHRADLRRP